MALNFTKRVADQIYGSIALTEVEYDIIRTRAFLRLKDVRQLGLAHFVFPGGDYSRLSHSLGSCHVAGQMLTSIAARGAHISDRQFQATRIAALLHDLGHYPFSHPTEAALRDWQRTKLAKGVDEPATYTHEEVGIRVMRSDPELDRVFRRHHIGKRTIGAIMSGRSNPAFLSHIVSSELDADRLDYMRRTAVNTGLPYGAPDLDYLIDHLVLDDNQRLCISEQALGAADHFLLCRYFDYRQIVFQNTVVGLEAALRASLLTLFDEGSFSLSKAAVNRAIRDGTWSNFDDGLAINALRSLRDKGNGVLTEGQIIQLDSILQRRPPKLIWSEEYVDARRNPSPRNADRQFRAVKALIPTLAHRFGIPESLWFPWFEARHLTNVASTVPLEELDDQGHVGEDLARQMPKSVNVLRRGEDAARPLQSIAQSFMKALADQALYMIRLYVLFPDGDEHQRLEIEQAAKQGLV